VARFFQMKEPAWIIFHIPSFMETYEAFWQDPTHTSYICLAIVFSICSHAARYCYHQDEEVPGKLGPALQVSDAFREISARCLALSNYTRPGPLKVEALILYFTSEFLRSTDAVLASSVIITITTRLAIHMGMHRDPKYYRGMTPFEGEMRRRVWALLVEIDSLVSFQFGLPSNINPHVCDTALPRNLHDEEFDESTTVLPPSRPETERTVTLYTITKARLSHTFRDITLGVGATVGLLHVEVMQFHKQLQETHASFPPCLRYRPFSQSLVDPLDLIMQRYWIELLYQKSRIVLHRKYLAVGRIEPPYAISRETCLDAASVILKHQYDIHCELQPGGRLHKEKWFATSLNTHDFLLANMILCLELSYLNAQAKSPAASATALEDCAKDTSREIIPRDQLLDILRTSRSTWEMTRTTSTAANRAFKILSQMLSLSSGDAFGSSPESCTKLGDTVGISSLAPVTLESGSAVTTCCLGLSSAADLSGLGSNLSRPTHEVVASSVNHDSLPDPAPMDSINSAGHADESWYPTRRPGNNLRPVVDSRDTYVMHSFVGEHMDASLAVDWVSVPGYHFSPAASDNAIASLGQPSAESCVRTRSDSLGQLFPSQRSTFP